jgi:hypothetical protein
VGIFSAIWGQFYPIWRLQASIDYVNFSSGGIRDILVPATGGENGAAAAALHR